jgi:hypothetical protein
VTLAVVLHDLGDPAGGARWREAAPDARWEAPDLPGHAGAPAPRSGAYDPTGPLTLARWRVAHHGVPGSLVVGVGDNAMGALLVASGGACAAVAVVDGLWGPWPVTPEARVEVMYAQVRAVLADPGARLPPPSTGLDPRTAHGYALVVTPRLCRPFWGAIEVPTLLVETPRSRTPAEERAERVSWFGGPTELVELDTAKPAAVLAAIAGWWGRSPGDR